MIMSLSITDNGTRNVNIHVRTQNTRNANADAWPIHILTDGYIYLGDGQPNISLSS